MSNEQGEVQLSLTYEEIALTNLALAYYLFEVPNAPKEVILRVNDKSMAAMGVDPQAVKHISLKCLLYSGRGLIHEPCSGTCDGHGSGVICDKPCSCICHRRKLDKEGVQNGVN